jgi:hypothetical protein
MYRIGEVRGVFVGQDQHRDVRTPCLKLDGRTRDEAAARGQIMRAVRIAFLVVGIVWLVAPAGNALRGFLADQEPGSLLSALCAGASVLAILLAVPVGLWRDARGDAGALRAALALTIALLGAWLVLGMLFVLSMGYALDEPIIVCGTLGLGLAAGLFFGTSPPRRFLYWLRRFAVGLALAVGLTFGTSWLLLFFAMTVPLVGFDTSSFAAAPVVWLAGWLAAEGLERRGHSPLGVGVGVGALALGLLVITAT